LARSGTEPREKTKILFVECNEPELERYAIELEERLPVGVEKVLLEDLAGRLKEVDNPSWRLAVTSFYHVHEVEALVEPRGIETFALLTEATLEGLNRLADLPSGTSVGVVGNTRTCTDNLLRSLRGAGLDHLNLFQVQEDDEDSRARIRGKGGGVRQRRGTEATEARYSGGCRGHRPGPHPEQGRRGDARAHAPQLFLNYGALPLRNAR
jgi:hypothetical protein